MDSTWLLGSKNFRDIFACWFPWRFYINITYFNFPTRFELVFFWNSKIEFLYTSKFIYLLVSYWNSNFNFLNLTKYLQLLVPIRILNQRNSLGFPIPNGASFHLEFQNQFSWTYYPNSNWLTQRSVRFDWVNWI